VYVLALVRPADALQSLRFPLNFALVLDRSFSMRGSSLQAMKEGVNALVDALGPQDSLAVVSFKGKADVIVPAQPVQDKAAIKAAVAHFGKIDILVNNAGITRDQLVMRMKRAEWDAVLTTNLTSAYLCIQEVIPGMLKQRWGRIINIASIFGQIGQAGQANYAASKAGLIGLTMAIAREVASRNITSNAIAPGFIETNMTAALRDEIKQAALKQIPLGRVGLPDDVAYAVAFLASEEASYITGHVLNVNGGLLMG